MKTLDQRDSYYRGYQDGATSAERLSKRPIHSNWKGTHPNQEYYKGYLLGLALTTVSRLTAE